MPECVDQTQINNMKPINCPDNELNQFLCCLSQEIF